MLFWNHAINAFVSGYTYDMMNFTKIK